MKCPVNHQLILEHLAKKSRGRLTIGECPGCHVELNVPEIPDYSTMIKLEHEFMLKQVANKRQTRTSQSNMNLEANNLLDAMRASLLPSGLQGIVMIAKNKKQKKKWEKEYPHAKIYLEKKMPEYE